ncbi:9961_t:CDS:2 [Entrophospora sp. SA101]|nr:9961_t:CDS:2 [Entrophospora sp. SA101]
MHNASNYQDAQSTYPYSSQEVELVESGQLSLSQLLHLFCNQEIFNMEDDECLILEIICMGQYTTQVHLNNYENTTFQKLNEDSLRKVLSNNKENLCVLEIEETNFCKYFTKEIEILTKILYDAQHKEKINPIYNVNNFMEYVSNKHPGFVHFFNTLLVSIRNKHCTYFKDDMGLFLVGTGTSCSGINMLSNVGLSTTYRSLINKMNKIEKDHALSVLEYLKKKVSVPITTNANDNKNLQQRQKQDIPTAKQILFNIRIQEKQKEYENLLK